MPRAEILSQGDEVVTGQIADTNAAWLSERLIDLGFHVVRHTTVGDEKADIIAALTEAAARSDVVICSGGLGPTDDDLTSEAVAQAFGCPLVFDDVAWQQIQAMFARFGRPIPDINRKQALLPEGSLRLDNDRGTAPGFCLPACSVPAHEGATALLACLPGVPHEMKAMFDLRVVPLLTQTWALRPGRLITLRTTGVGESALQERIGTFERPGFVLGYRTMPGENLVKLRVSAEVPPDEVSSVVADLHQRIGSPVFAIDGLDLPGGDLVQTLARLLLASGATLAVAESCTGGRIAAACTGVPGSSAWFVEGVVAYANEAKTRHLGVPPTLLEAHGAVSEPVARAMADGIRERAGTTFAISTTGIAGPDGGTADKPVGTVHIALATPSGTSHRLLRLGGDRARIQAYATAAALDLLRRHLQGLPVS